MRRTEAKVSKPVPSKGRRSGNKKRYSQNSNEGLFIHPHLKNFRSRGTAGNANVPNENREKRKENRKRIIWKQAH